VGRARQAQLLAVADPLAGPDAGPGQVGVEDAVAVVQADRDLVAVEAARAAGVAAADLLHDAVADAPDRRAVRDADVDRVVRLPVAKRVRAGVGGADQPARRTDRRGPAADPASGLRLLRLA